MKSFLILCSFVILTVSCYGQTSYNGESLENQVSLTENMMNYAIDGNIIIKGKRKVLENGPGDDVTIRCKGTKGNCLIVQAPQGLVSIFDESGERKEQTVKLDSTQNFSLQFGTTRGGENYVDVTFKKK